MGVSVRLSRNTRVYLPFWVAIPLWLIVAAVWAVILAAMLLWWLLVVLPGKAITAWRDSPRRATRQAQRPEAVAANQAVLSLAHNMAQENGMTAAMIDVITEYVKNKAITPEQAVARLSDAVEGAR